jgi:hypothetical protein
LEGQDLFLGCFSRIDPLGKTFKGKKGPNPEKAIPMTESLTNPLYGAIDAKLEEIAAANPTLPSWHEALNGLGPHSPKSERLAVYRAVRAAGSVPAEAGLYLIAWMVDLMTDDRAEEGLQEEEKLLELIRQKYDLEEDAPANSADVPVEYREAMQEMHQAWDRLYVGTLEECGEQEMANLFRTDREQYDRLYEIGRQFFHGAEDEEDMKDDAWLDRLLEEVAACVEAESPMGPLGMRYREEEGFWEVWVFPTPVELVGGAHDGEVVVPGFSLDLEELQAAFDEVVAFVWNALGLNYPEGPHVAIEGAFQGREVYLQVLARAPEDEEPGLKVDARRRPRPLE